MSDSSSSPSVPSAPAEGRTVGERVLEHFRIDWPGWLSMAVAAVLYLIKGFNGILPHDPGLFAYGAEQVARGQLPYLGVFNQTGPLGQLVPGIGVWIGSHVGISGLTAARATMLVVSVAAVGAAYIAGKLLWGSR